VQATDDGDEQAAEDPRIVLAERLTIVGRGRRGHVGPIIVQQTVTRCFGMIRRGNGSTVHVVFLQQ